MGVIMLCALAACSTESKPAVPTTTTTSTTVPEAPPRSVEFKVTGSGTASIDWSLQGLAHSSGSVSLPWSKTVSVPSSIFPSSSLVTLNAMVLYDATRPSAPLPNATCALIIDGKNVDTESVGPAAFGVASCSASL